MQTFPVVGNLFAWKVGKGYRIRIGIDPSVGIGNDFKLSGEVIHSLHSDGIVILTLATSAETSTIWHQDWKKTKQIGRSIEG